ncbi:MAG: UDP-glucuronosyltransferase [Deltaproteobacteria bacterium]|nr:UDP-glucuronosyltransferase [Deltaproteobacteria bacterium]
MKILYGVVGEGMGHATRSKVVLEHLQAEGHELLVVASDRAHGFLKRFFPEVIEIEGLNLEYEQGAVDRSETFFSLLKRLPEMVATNVKRFVELSLDYAPDLVISDFESFAYAFGRAHDIPVISIDNMQVLNRCSISEDIPKAYQKDFQIAKAVVKAKLPGAHHYLISSFFFPEIRKERTSLHPPILRPEILATKPSDGAHVLVYQTSTSDTEMLEMLRGFDAEFRVYGYRRDEDLGNVQLKDFSEAGFIADLASCQAVIANGGFSLLSEAVYLGKPVLAVPVGKQFEQMLNGLYLAKLGYGEMHEALRAEAIGPFLAKAKGYSENLKAHSQDGNKDLLGKLDTLIADLR